jgi:hypothetical protein
MQNVDGPGPVDPEALREKASSIRAAWEEGRDAFDWSSADLRRVMEKMHVYVLEQAADEIERARNAVRSRHAVRPEVVHRGYAQDAVEGPLPGTGPAELSVRRQVTQQVQC